MSLIKVQDFMLPPAPHWLQGKALAKWVEVWPLLDAGIKPELHGDTVAAYCQAYSDFVEAVTTASAMSGPRGARSLSEIKNAALRQMMDLGALIGLSPDTPLRWEDYEPAKPERELEDDSTGGDSAGEPTAEEAV